MKKYNVQVNSDNTVGVSLSSLFHWDAPMEAWIEQKVIGPGNCYSASLECVLTILQSMEIIPYPEVVGSYTKQIPCGSIVGVDEEASRKLALEKLNALNALKKGWPEAYKRLLVSVSDITRFDPHIPIEDRILTTSVVYKTEPVVVTFKIDIKEAM